ncbi:fibulin-7 [Xenopus laevis]|uniref:Fibulin-7 n=1 Tax=Xenopus laevis TaxID=8355 RepID=A0A8J0V229_XENLA|nr:fibulin-7 [Xenopus laevis]
MKSILLLNIILHLLWFCNGQACSEQQEALKVLRQVQKLLTEHEASYLRGLRALNQRITQLKDQLLKGETKENCPRLNAPRHGRILGGKLKVGHEIHFLCDPGYRLVGSETRTCQKNQTWSGEPALCTELASLSNASSLQPAKCSSFQGTQHCTCDPGYLIQPGALCQDVDECSMFHRNAEAKICVHECINTAGSYLCVCPEGYVLDPHHNTCQDIDECSLEQNPCPGGSLCVNLYGGFVCVQPECPKPKQNTSYVKTSVQQCEKSPCLMGSKSCLEAPRSISFHSISLQSQLPAPRVLFTMSAPRSLGDNQRFSIIRGKGRGLEVRQASRHRWELVLNKPLSGPAEIQVDVEMAETSSEALPGKHIFSVTIYVSKYPF